MRVQICLQKWTALLNVQATVRDWPEPVFGKPGGGDRAEADIFKTIWYGREKTGWAYHGLATEKVHQRMVSPVLLIKQSASIWHTLFINIKYII